jgi:HAD superfamily hydrolase (TIGR01509 family)
MKSEQKVKAVLLDMDGTLIESNALHAESWQRAFAEFGIEVSFDTALRQIGKGGDHLLPVFVPKEKVETTGKAIEKFRKELFEREYLSRVKPFPKVRQLVERMKDAGLTIAMASSAGKEELQRYKKIANIDDLVEEETTSEDAENSKPSPDIFAAALKRVGMHAGEAISLGDTPYDAEASTQCGIRTVGVTSGGWSREDLLDAGCSEVYEDAADLLANFDRSLFGKSSS